MELCCNQNGGNPVEFEPDCYSWCHVSVNMTADIEFQEALQMSTDSFGYCLSHGENANTPTGMVCNEGTNFTQPDASATITSTSSRGMPSIEATSSLGGSSTSDSGSGGAVQSGNAKAAGLVGGLLLAAGAFGGVV